MASRLYVHAGIKYLQKTKHLVFPQHDNGVQYLSVVVTATVIEIFVEYEQAHACWSPPNWYSRHNSYVQ